MFTPMYRLAMLIITTLLVLAYEVGTHVLDTMHTTMQGM